MGEVKCIWTPSFDDCWQMTRWGHRQDWAHILVFIHNHPEIVGLKNDQRLTYEQVVSAFETWRGPSEYALAHDAADALVDAGLVQPKQVSEASS